MRGNLPGCNEWTCLFTDAQIHLLRSPQVCPDVEPKPSPEDIHHDEVGNTGNPKRKSQELVSNSSGCHKY